MRRRGSTTRTCSSKDRRFTNRIYRRKKNWRLYRWCKSLIIKNKNNSHCRSSRRSISLKASTTLRIRYLQVIWPIKLVTIVVIIRNLTKLRLFKTQSGEWVAVFWYDLKGCRPIEQNWEGQDSKAEVSFAKIRRGTKKANRKQQATQDQAEWDESRGETAEPNRTIFLLRGCT
jgi:hypothetical protein